MGNRELSDYIQQQLNEGKTKDVIKSELIGAGWQASDVNQVLGLSNSSTPPPPPPPRPTAPTSSYPHTGEQRLDSKAVWLFFFGSSGSIIFLVVWLGFSSIVSVTDLTGAFFGIFIIIFLVALVLAFVWAKLTHHFYRFELTDEGFKKELGVIIKKYVTIPYERIQNVDINRGILARILGLSDLNIQTAGSSSTSIRGGAEGKLPGLSREDAEQLRDELVHRSRQTRNQGL